MPEMDRGPRGELDEPPAPACPFCGSDRTELLSLFGSTSLTSQYRCASCRSAFESVKWGALSKGGDAWTK